MSELAHILEQFGVSARALPHGNGHINRTYLVESVPRVILQRINTDVFHRPCEVMENVMEVTSYLREKIKENGGDPTRETLTFLRTREGLPYYIDSGGSYYRMCYFVENTLSLEAANTPEEFAEAAHAFGKFQNMLADFPAEKLYETIELFHDTENRYRQFEEALEKDRAGRAKNVGAEIEFALSHKKYAAIITDAIKEGTVPVRVTHNDTKLNNVLLDPVTKKGVCVIDLDTVMPGSMLYDFGDALRFGASTASEDEQELDKVHFDLEKFEAFTKAFLEEVHASITPKEKELLPLSALIMTLECGTRFLTDHLNGDIYFGIHRENHNLDRCRTQYKLVAEMEALLPQMAKIVAKY